MTIAAQQWQSQRQIKLSAMRVLLEFFLRFSLEHSVAHGVTSRCEYQRLCTEIALHHRDVNYKGVTVTLKDVGSMFIVLAQRIRLIHRLTSTNTTEIESFPANNICASGLSAALCTSIRWKSAPFSVHGNSVVSKSCIANVAY